MSDIVPADSYVLCNLVRGTVHMIISTKDSIERNFRITNNNAIDMHVGKRARLRRTSRDMSQGQLGTELNITFQQVQKYERGPNRISASHL
jgi:ribosome-binding protein aMBF1 (putative translation factor)